MPGLDSQTKLLIHCDGSDGDTTFTDVSFAPHTMTSVGTVQVDTATAKFDQSALFDGDSDAITSADSPDWDITGSTGDNWTIDLWVNHAVTGVNETYIMQGRDDLPGDRWNLQKGANDRLDFSTRTNDTEVVGVVGNVVLLATTWYHIAMCKVGTDYGLYVNGTQGGYTSTAGTATMSADLYIGVSNRDTAADFRFMNGWMDEIRIQNSNYFNAAPTSANTDSFTVPAAPYDTSAAAPDVGIMTPTLHWGGV